MTLGTIFWLVYIIGVLLGGFFFYRHGIEFIGPSDTMSLTSAVLFFLLGWKNFGFIVKE